MSSAVRTVDAGPYRLVVETIGAGEPLVYAHGLSANRAHALRTLAPLAERFAVTTFDQRGHGDSTPARDETAYDLDAMTGDLAAVVDAVCDATGQTRVAVGG